MKNNYEFEENFYKDNPNFDNFSIPGPNTSRNDFFPGFNFNTTINNPFMNMKPNMNQNMNQGMNANMNQGMNQGMMNENNQLLNSNEGFMRGNLFRDLYDPYKSYQPMRLIPNSEQAEMLLQVSELSFASHELRLYLDIYPNDREMIALFNEYRSAANEATRNYEEKFGPIEWSALSNNNVFSWQNDTWPWEMGVM